MICPHCEEPIVKGEYVIPSNGGTVFLHRNCGLRLAIGSVAHILGDCSCYVPDSTEGDPPEMTRRQAADAAARMWDLLNDLKKVI